DIAYDIVAEHDARVVRPLRRRTDAPALAQAETLARLRALGAAGPLLRARRGPARAPLAPLREAATRLRADAATRRALRRRLPGERRHGVPDAPAARGRRPRPVGCDRR